MFWIKSSLISPPQYTVIARLKIKKLKDARRANEISEQRCLEIRLGITTSDIAALSMEVLPMLPREVGSREAMPCCFENDVLTSACPPEPSFFPISYGLSSLPVPLA